MAFLTVLIRGWRSSAEIETTLLLAWLALLAFAAIGGVAGQLAEWIMMETVQTKVSAELAALQARETVPAGTQDNSQVETARAA